MGLTSVVGGAADTVAVDGAGTDPLLEPAPGCPLVAQAASPTV